MPSIRLRFTLAILLALGIAACGGKEEKEAGEASEGSAAPAMTTAAPDSTAQAAMRQEAKIAEADARAAALKEVPGATVDTFELERENGKLIYSYDLKVAGKEGIEEVAIDAVTGAMVAHTHESPADEAKEAAEDAKAAAAKKGGT